MFSFTERASRWCATHPWLTLAFCFAVVVAGGYLATGIGDSLTTDAGTTIELESDKAERLIEERIGADIAPTELVVVRSNDLTVDDPAFRDYVAHIQQGLAELEPERVSAALFTSTARPLSTDSTSSRQASTGSGASAIWVACDRPDHGN